MDILPTRSSVEQRILAKVSPLEGTIRSEDSTLSTPLRELPHNHQKGKQCRACRTLRKLAKEEKEKQIYSESVKGITGVIRELTVEAGNIGNGIAQAHGQAFGRWLGNTDPVTWGAGGVAAGVYIVFLSNFVDHLGNAIGVKNASKKIGLDILTGLPKSIADTAADALGRNDATGTYGWGVTTEDGLQWRTDLFRWYTNPTARAAGLALGSLAYPLHAESVDRIAGIGGFTIPATSIAQSQQNTSITGKWGVFTPQNNLVSLADSQQAAQQFASSYNANPAVAGSLKPATVRQV